MLARGVEQEGLLARDPRGHVDGSAGKRRRRLAGGAGTEQSGAGAVRRRRRRVLAAAAARSGEHWRGGVRVVERETERGGSRGEEEEKRLTRGARGRDK